MRLKASVLKEQQHNNKMKPPEMVEIPIKIKMLSYQEFALPDRGEVYLMDYHRIDHGWVEFYALNNPVPVSQQSGNVNLMECFAVRKKHWWEL